MKTIGLLGGMSWESTAVYYRIINETVKARLGKLHSAQLVLYSVDFEEIDKLLRAGNWEFAGEILASAARQVESAGADFLVLCTNTMHRVADRIEEKIGIPILHIADATAEEVKTAGFTKVGLLGTRYTMEQNFYRGRLANLHGLDVLVPSGPDREVVHEVIYRELCQGKFREASRRRFRTILDKLTAKGAEGMILGCTEISMLLRPEDSPIPLFNTTGIHARKAVDLALTRPAED